MKRKKRVLYQPICRRCHFEVKSSLDLALTKMRMNDHLVKSHGFKFDFSNKSPLSDYAEIFKIMRWTKPEDINSINDSNPEFYKNYLEAKHIANVACCPKIPSVSV